MARTAGRTSAPRERRRRTRTTGTATDDVRRLAARLAHDLANPLAGISAGFLLIRDAVPQDHPHYRFVGAIERELARLIDITRSLNDAAGRDDA